MKANGKYRFTLQFGMSTEDENRAGEFLECLGNRKSAVIVMALNEYLDSHPEICSGNKRIKVELGGISKEELTKLVLQIIAEQRRDDIKTPVDYESPQLSITEELCTDIKDMLGDLELFG